MQTPVPCRLAAFSLLGAVAACNPPEPETTPIQAIAEEAAPVVSPTQVRERSEMCTRASGERFRRDWSESGVPTPYGATTVEFASHYNTKMNVCFYLLTVRHFTEGGAEGVAPSGTLRKILFDFGDEETYGEFVGPLTPGSRSDRFLARCKIDELFCSTEAEWNRLARPYMEE